MEHVEGVIGLLAPGGVLIKDDLTPGVPIETDPLRADPEGVALSKSDPNACPAIAQAPGMEQVVARVQRLCETPRPDGGYPLATYVEGYFLGDITAIVAAAIRSERFLEREAEVCHSSSA